MPDTGIRARGGNGKERRHASEPAGSLPRFEASDVSAKAMVRWAVGLLVFTALSMLVVFGYYASLHGPVGRQARLQKMEQRLPPWPRLQANPARDIADYEREQTTLMNSYGWVRRETGTVRIPVRRAQQLVLEHGLPAWNSERRSNQP